MLSWHTTTSSDYLSSEKRNFQIHFPFKPIISIFSANMLDFPSFVLSKLDFKRKATKSQWGVGAVLRWRRNRMGRPLSPTQIHQKNISTLSKFHKTTSECQQRTSGTQKSSSLSLKRGRKKYKRQRKRQRSRKGA